MKKLRVRRTRRLTAARRMTDDARNIGTVAGAAAAATAAAAAAVTQSIRHGLVSDTSRHGRGRQTP